MSDVYIHAYFMVFSALKFILIDINIMKFRFVIQANLIKSLGIVNDTDDTIKLEDLMLVIKKHLFHNKDKIQDHDSKINNSTINFKYN